MINSAFDNLATAKNVGKQDFDLGMYNEDTANPSEAGIKMYERVIRLLPRIAKKSRFLIYGAGYGDMSSYIAETYGCRVDSLGTDKDKCKHINKRISKAGIEKVHQVLEYPNYESSLVPIGYYHVVWCKRICGEIEDRPLYLGQVQRSLQPEGRLVLMDFFNDDLEDTSTWTESEIERLSSRIGLQKVYSRDLTDDYVKHLKELETYLGSKGVKDGDIKPLKELAKSIGAKGSKTRFQLLMMQKIND